MRREIVLFTVCPHIVKVRGDVHETGGSYPSVSGAYPKDLTVGVLESTGVTGDSSSGRETVDLMAGRTGIFCGRTGIFDET